MKLSQDAYKAFYKRACVDLEFHNREDVAHSAQNVTLDEDRVKAALFDSTQTTNHPPCRGRIRRCCRVVPQLQTSGRPPNAVL